MKKYLLPKQGNFYKANLHCHSNLSDGYLSPEELKDLYKSHGYSALAYTDHDIFIPHHELTDENFIALAGFETAFNQKYPGQKTLKACHLCCIARTQDVLFQPAWNEKYAYVGNAKENRSKVKYDKSQPLFEREYTPECISLMAKMAREQGFFVTYNHPAWSMETSEQYTKYENINAMEIFNNHDDKQGYPAYTINAYDDILRSGKEIFALATDDNHNKYPTTAAECDSFGGYVMIKADELKYEAITDALFQGNFYASSGPEIYDLYIENNSIYISCSEAIKITINKGTRGAESILAEHGKTITEAEFKFEDDDIYVRLTVVDKYGRFTNTNAYFI